MESNRPSDDLDIAEVEYSLSEVRKHRIQIVPIVKELVVNYHDTAITAKRLHDRLFQKYTHLKARYAQLQVEFNAYCTDRNAREDKWQEQARDAVLDDLRRLVDTAVSSKEASYQKTTALVVEHLEMSNENAQLRAQVEELRRENRALKAKKV
ncbi:uncharacterized protein F4807DRAFT_72377 [Annulohypoxylon truncatum]|uniref:uncharacterized protein n=1 Tax=Annulohypoxylon truncatum TaxID=327061 RepID=UPI002008EA4D|nr:uncharacterized protein F4807DRAFT_72377 [Annulohypoxylon truncatum]KAI1210183.1 hypothetical protein F4807DRAFT_72377 [Annulohypoxylon truncatum]